MTMELEHINEKEIRITSDKPIYTFKCGDRPWALVTSDEGPIKSAGIRWHRRKGERQVVKSKTTRARPAGE